MMSLINSPGSRFAKHILHKQKGTHQLITDIISYGQLDIWADTVSLYIEHLWWVK